MVMWWVWLRVAPLLLCPATYADCIRAGYFNISMAIGARFRLGADIHLEPNQSVHGALLPPMQGLAERLDQCANSLGYIAARGVRATAFKI